MNAPENNHRYWPWIAAVTVYSLAVLIVFWIYQSFLTQPAANALSIYYGVLFIVPALLPYSSWKRPITWLEHLVVLFCLTIAVGVLAVLISLVPPPSTCLLLILGLFLVPIGKHLFNSNRFTTGLILSGVLLICQPILAIVHMKFRSPIGLEYLKQARQEFPQTDLDERLAVLSNSTSSVRLLSELQVLKERQEMISPNRRHRLEELHKEYFRRFIQANGFGAGRMANRSLQDLRLPPLANQPFHADDPTTYNDRFDAEETQASNSLPDEYHRQAYLNFLPRDSFGFTNDQGLTTGFQPHSFTSPLPVGTFQDAKTEEKSAWRLQRLELVSLLRFQQPQVYVLDHLPRMDQLQSDSIHTRSLTQFEKEALKQIGQDKQFVVVEVTNQQANDRLQMMGAIPALQSCLTCHQGETGQLLGAFSYQFVKVPSDEVEADEGQ